MTSPLRLLYAYLKRGVVGVGALTSAMVGPHKLAHTLRRCDQQGLATSELNVFESNDMFVKVFL